MPIAETILEEAENSSPETGECLESTFAQSVVTFLESRLKLLRDGEAHFAAQLLRVLSIAFRSSAAVADSFSRKRVASINHEAISGWGSW